jgi:hypothetical protein
MTADLIYLSTRRQPAKAVPVVVTPAPEPESAKQLADRVLTNDVMNGAMALVLARSKTAKPMTPEVRRERIAALAIGATDLARFKIFGQAAEMLQVAADLAFTEAGIKGRQKGRGQPTTTKR